MTLPVYLCPKITRPLQLSGKLDDPLWQTAPVVTLRDAASGAAPRQATEVRLLYDASFLYIGFHCVDDYIWGTFTEHESAVWAEECVEAFINPSGAPHQYYEINVSPLNTVFDACILNRRSPASPRIIIWPLTQFDPKGLKTVAHVEGTLGQPGAGKFWNIEYAVPFDQLPGAPHVPPVPGDEWRLNLYRIDSPRKGEFEYYSWSTLGIADFHRPWDFGVLRFG